MADLDLTTYDLAELTTFVADDNAPERDAVSDRALYQALNALEDQALDIRARRKVLGDELRRRSAVIQREGKLAMLSADDRAALAREALAAERAGQAPSKPRSQAVGLRQGG